MALIGEAAEETLPTVALRGIDTSRGLRGYVGGALICLAGAVALTFGDGSGVMRALAASTVAIAGLACAAIAWLHRDGKPFHPAETSAVGLTMSAAALISIAYVGVLTVPTVVLVTLVVATSMGHEARGRLIFVTVSLGYGVLGTLAVTGVIPKVAPFAARLDTGPLVRGIIVVEVVIAVSYYFGRSARRSTAAALEQVMRARRQLAQRDAQLHEAQQDLDRLLRGGRAGRLSGHELGGYMLAEVIGRGAMGEVYRATVVASGREVAVKVLNPSMASEPTLVDRFFREARVSSSLASPHIVSVIGSGQAPDGSPYLAMELLRGATLSEQLREVGALDLEEVETLVSQVAEGLAAAHVAGIVHRDIKPGNVFLVDGPPRVWKVLDFGVSKLLAGGSTLTGDGVIGTPGYMPPEQAFGRDVDGRADVFALGALAYRALTGRPPFDGPDVVSVLLNAAQRQPLRPNQLVALPEDVELVLALALAKDRDHRFSSPSDMATALARARRSELPESLRIHAYDLLSRTPWDSDVPFAMERPPDSSTRVVVQKPIP
jgi:serine/threonine-protein kinase